MKTMLQSQKKWKIKKLMNNVAKSKEMENKEIELLKQQQLKIYEKQTDILKYIQEKDENKNNEYEMLQKQINENQKNILTYIEENITHNDESKNDEYKDLLDKYNTFCGKHEELVNEFGKESTKRNKQWDEIVGKLQKEIGLVNEKLMENGMELEMYKSGQDESFKNISDSMQQSKIQNQEMLGNIKNEMTEILSCMTRNENNVAKSKEMENKEIDLLKQQQL
eukprot:529710_1